MYFLVGIVLLTTGILLLIYAAKKVSIRRMALIRASLGIMLAGAGAGMLFLVMSGRVVLPLSNICLDILNGRR